MHSVRERLLATSMICGAALASAAAVPAFAQDEVSEIVVTGSRIPQPNLTSVSPVQVVNSQEVQLGGRPVTADLMNQLPQVTQNASSGLSSTSNPLSGPGGVATIDLRGLGQTRTLVLVDGRRLGIGDPNTGNPNPSADINQIPSQLIERVEVLTGGASATYGSDAIAGVVNFVMKRDFEGLEIDGQWGVNQHSQSNDFVQGLLRASNIAIPKESVWDGESRDLSIVFGANSPDGRGNVTGFFTYHDQDPVTQFKRDWSACQVNANAAGVAGCAGSSNSNIFYLSDGTSDAFAVLGNQFVPWGTPGTNPPQRFNSNEYSYLLQQSTRYTAGYMARYEVNKHLEFYNDFSFMNDRTNVVIAPTAVFQGDGVSPLTGWLVNCNNPLMSAQQQATFCTPAQIAAGESIDLTIGRRNIEGGGRNQFYEHQNYRVVAGARGEIVDSWKYDIYASYYYTTLYQASQNYLAKSRVQNALQVVQGPNGPVCVSGGACVPYNIFRDGGVTDAALAYLDISGTSQGSTSQRVLEGTITGDLGDYGVKSPWAQDGVGVAAGFHYRRENLRYSPDDALLSNQLTGAGGASVALDNSIRVTEGFAEARLPIIQDMPFAKAVQAELGYRYSDYSTGFSADTYKIGMDWAPNDDIRFRASFQSAIRAPNLIELYTPQSVTNTSDVSVDPCAPSDGAPATASLEQCLRTGVTAAQYGNGSTTNTIVQCPSGQCAVLTGGNTNLTPEKAKTVSVGFTFTPTFIPGLVASVDYYRVKLTDGIGSVPLDITLTRCLETGDAQYCSLVRRAGNGILFGSDISSAGYISGTNVNIGKNIYSGIDVQANYNLPLEAFGWEDMGRVSVSLVGGYVLDAKTSPLPGDPAYDCAGLFGPSCQTVLPKWRHTARVSWNTPWDVTLSAAWRYIGSVKYEADSDEPSIGGNTTPDAFNPKLPARSYLDLSGVWNVNEKLTMRAGINNVLDQDPPLVNSLIAGTGLPNTYPTYDLLGRKMFVGFTASF